MKNPMSMGMDTGITIQNPMDMGMGMDMTFENGYECGNNSTCPEPAPCPSLLVLPNSSVEELNWTCKNLGRAVGTPWSTI